MRGARAPAGRESNLDAGGLIWILRNGAIKWKRGEKEKVSSRSKAAEAAAGIAITFTSSCQVTNQRAAF